MLNFFIEVNLFIMLPLIVYGFLISKIKRETVRSLKEGSKWWIYSLSGFIGTPVHEISHLIFHILFGHKVQGLALYRPIKSKKDGVLGYVNVTYNTRSLYNNLGLFFSGIAPMIGGSFMIILLMKILTPEILSNWHFMKIGYDSVEMFLNEFWETLKNNIECLAKGNYLTVKGFIFFVSAFSIAVHMSISPEDLKGAIKGGIYFEIIIMIISIFLKLFKLEILTAFVSIGAMYILSIFIFGLIFNLIAFTFAKLVSMV